MASSATMDVAVERWTSTVVLGDGTSALIRPITPDDAPALQEFHDRQSADSRYLRFFSPKPTLSTTELDALHERRLRRPGGVRASRSTASSSAGRATSAGRTATTPRWRSWSTTATRARASPRCCSNTSPRSPGRNGIERFTAQTLGDNRAMLSVFASAGWPVQRRFESGVIDVDFALADTAEFIDSVERREQRADSRAMARLLLASVDRRDRRVATRRARSVSDAVAHGSPPTRRRRVYPVNPDHDTSAARRRSPSVADIPDDVGAGGHRRPGRQRSRRRSTSASRKRVRGAIVVTSVDDEPDVDIAGDRRPTPAATDCASSGRAAWASRRRCPRSALQAALVDVPLPPGNVAISMQSGTLGSAVAAAGRPAPAADCRGSCRSATSRDVSGNDLLQFWEDDEATSVIAIYTESLGNPRKFARIARRVSRTRPIVSVRTGAALVGDGTDALYANTGVIEVPTVTALLDTARTLSTQPLMAGRRVAVVTNSPARVLATASLHRRGLEVVPPPTPLTWRSTSDDYAAASARGARRRRHRRRHGDPRPTADRGGRRTDRCDRRCESRRRSRWSR